jgi:hypothetical protein
MAAAARSLGAAVVVAAAYLPLWNDVASAEPMRLAQASSTPVYGDDEPITIDGIEFRLRPVTILDNTGYIALKVSVTATNLAKSPVSVFLMQRETAGTTDTALTFHYVIMDTSGISSCINDRRECAHNADDYMVSLYPATPDSMQFTMQSTMGNLYEPHSALTQAATVDLTMMFYVREPDGSVQFIPISFANARLKNLIQ